MFNKFSGYIIKLRILVQALFLFFINYDLKRMYELIKSRSASISQLRTKTICFPSLNCYSCPSAGYSCPMGSFQFWINESSENINFGEKINIIGLFIIGTLFMFGSLLGRFICGFICPFGFFQDLISRFSGKNLFINKFFRSMKYIILLMCVILLPMLTIDDFSIGPVFCKYICPSGTLFAGVPLLVFDENLRESASYITLIKVLILFFVLIMSFFSKRFFCKTMCPLGAVLGFFNKISLFYVHVDSEKCVKCKKCYDSCPANLNVVEEINSAECIRCLKCVRSCEQSAIKIKNSWGKS